MIISQFFVEFIFFSFLGWVWESIYCTLREHHWMDRGFLFGPYCPIYGSCVVGAEILFGYILPGNLQEMSIPVIFLISMAGSAIAEYATSWVLEKRFHARWWDYSNIPLNLNGRICLPASLGFGLAGVLCVKVLIPFMSGLHSEIPGLAYEGVAMILAMVFGADFALTETSLNSLLKRIEEYKAGFNERAQERYVMITEAPEILAATINEQREGLREKRAELGQEIRQKEAEFRQLAEESKEKRDLAAEEFFNKLNGLQLSKLKNIKKFKHERAEDNEKLEILKKRLESFRIENDHPTAK